MQVCLCLHQTVLCTRCLIFMKFGMHFRHLHCGWVNVYLQNFSCIHQSQSERKSSQDSHIVIAHSVQNFFFHCTELNSCHGRGFPLTSRSTPRPPQPLVHRAPALFPGGTPAASGVPRNLFGGGGQQIQSRTGRTEIWGQYPSSQGSGDSCNLVQEISFHIVKFS